MLIGLPMAGFDIAEVTPWHTSDIC